MDTAYELKGSLYWTQHRNSQSLTIKLQLKCRRLLSHKWLIIPKRMYRICIIINCKDLVLTFSNTKRSICNWNKKPKSSNVSEEHAACIFRTESLARGDQITPTCLIVVAPETSWILCFWGLTDWLGWCPQARCKLLCWGLHSTETEMCQTMPLGYKMTSHCKRAFPSQTGLYVTGSPDLPKSLRGCNNGPLREKPLVVTSKLIARNRTGLASRRNYQDDTMS
jgi:hypothetical protein